MPPAGWAGTATLAFTPVNGLVYTLDASITVAGDGNWIALGFVNGQSASADPALNRFIDHDTVGKAWMLKSGNGSGSALLGNTTGTTSNVAWASGVPSGAGNFDMRIVLDTTGGTGAWTATWYAKESSQTSYTEVRSTATLLAENITSVGLAKSNTGVTGSVTSFSLTSVGTPDPDADQDGYEDAWELATFGTTAYGPDDDPDGDGFTTAQELTAGTDPANVLSTPDDTDADGMDDALEISLFGNLGQGPLDDFDGDGVGNLGEVNAGTDPADPNDFPLVSLLAITDGNAATDENGYAGSAINSIAFAQDNLITVGNQQFISYYQRHATDPGHPDNNTVVVGRRQLDEAHWEISTPASPPSTSTTPTT
jgi:hypothetical protein